MGSQVFRELGAARLGFILPSPTIGRASFLKNFSASARRSSVAILPDRRSSLALRLGSEVRSSPAVRCFAEGPEAVLIRGGSENSRLLMCLQKNPGMKAPDVCVFFLSGTRFSFSGKPLLVFNKALGSKIEPWQYYVP